MLLGQRRCPASPTHRRFPACEGTARVLTSRTELSLFLRPASHQAHRCSAHTPRTQRRAKVSATVLPLSKLWIRGMQARNTCRIALTMSSSWRNAAFSMHVPVLPTVLRRHGMALCSLSVSFFLSFFFLCVAAGLWSRRKRVHHCGIHSANSSGSPHVLRRAFLCGKTTTSIRVNVAVTHYL